MSRYHARRGATMRRTTATSAAPSQIRLAIVFAAQRYLSSRLSAVDARPDQAGGGRRCLDVPPTGYTTRLNSDGYRGGAGRPRTLSGTTGARMGPVPP